jgi:LPXTG-site transpeptidase (sortase) family protein
VNTLDNLLKSGPAHYINSADLGQAGNLIIFAHSSHLPIVINKMFQAFNKVPDLNAGDSITIVGSDGKNYLYSVVSVVKADVNNGTTIDTSPTHGTNLTLVTCDTLTGVSARFVLTATFVGVSN